jgi:pyruvate formate lyase activating enzyme
VIGDRYQTHWQTKEKYFMGVTGRIHSFESFGTIDGPGIRFVVFMQGCPLQCIYCHNRDTWDPKGGREYNTDQVFAEMKKYINYIRLSNGGITVSGGEPVHQAEFTAELFKKCRDAGIHTALDTSGFADIEKVEELLANTDLVLLDIKHVNEEKHKIITGSDNKKIRKFARYTSEKGIPVWIRYVLVPGLTDSEEDLQSASEFIKGMKNVQKIEVLPYHTMGKYKWDNLGLAYPLAEISEPDDELLARAKSILG